MEWQLFGDIIGILIAIGVGMGCGSYSTMPYYRLPSGEACAGKWLGKKSHCTNCNTQLRTRDLLPVLNWLLTRGKCQFCGAKISGVYFFIEFTIVLISVLLFLKFGFEYMQFYIITLGLGCCLVILTATDYTYKTMPDPVLVVAVMFGFLYRALMDGQIYDMVFTFTIAVLSGLIYATIYKRITGREFKNYGYLKLIAIAGIWLNFISFMFFIVLAGILAFAIRKTPIPLAAAITLPFMLIIYFPELPYLVF